MHNRGKDAVVGRFDEHEEGAFVAISDFCREANFGEGFDELPELFRRTSFICNSSAQSIIRKHATYRPCLSGS